MNRKWIKLSSVALLSLYLAACDTNNDEDVVEDESAEIVEEDESTEVADSEEETDEDHDQDEDHEDEDHHDHSSPDEGVQEMIEIEGMAQHYHTGELVELVAVLSEDSEYDDWHWYTRTDEESEWEIISGQNTDEYVGEAPEESLEMRAVLYDDEHNPFAESAPVELEVDNH